MPTRIMTIASLFLIAFAIAFSASVYNELPENMASYWNAANQVEGYLPRFWGAFLTPAITAVMLFLFLVIPKKDPLKDNINKFRNHFNSFAVFIVVFLVYIHILTLRWNLGFDQINMAAATIPTLGIIFIYIGILMRKMKRNYSIGIRTPWTLNNDQVWDETHSLGSKLFILSGIVSILGVGFGSYVIWFTLIPVLGSAIFLIIYSYIIYHRLSKP